MLAQGLSFGFSGFRYRLSLAERMRIEYALPDSLVNLLARRPSPTEFLSSSTYAQPLVHSNMVRSLYTFKGEDRPPRQNLSCPPVHTIALSRTCTESAPTA